MDASSDNRIIVVCGPTATGKTRLALSLCRDYNGEMVGADSMQVYRGLPIGTAAPTPAELGDIPTHLVAFLPPEAGYSVAGYLAGATQAIDDIRRRSALPIICGGTGLYIQSLVNGLRFTDEKVNAEEREALQTAWDVQGGEAMLARLAKHDPEYAGRLHPNDKKRILRALEESERHGTTLAQRNAASRAGVPPYRALLIGLDYADRALLYAAIERRVDQMMAGGLLDEAERVYRQREQFRTAAQAIGYKEFFPFFAGAPLEGCVEKLKQATRNYAKRQLTWFRKMESIHWLDARSPGLRNEAGELVEKFMV